jgi:soluble lytic murein transglycosylase-like protein
VLGGSALGFYALEQVSRLRAELGALREQTEKRTQQLDAGIRFDSRRQRLLLGVRDQILAANASLGPGRAYDYATALVTACEKYPTVDPLLLLAIGTAESGFNASATSHAKARNLYQILPSTDRMLANMLGWQFGEDLLYEPAKNTALAAFYLHILFTTYNDESLVLAEYNGGPLNAGYMRAGGAKASAETRSYVAKVLALRERLKKKFDELESLPADPVQAEASREGMRLGERRAS